MRTNFDLSPYRRSTVGFDRLFDMLETGMRSDPGDNYPPFDLERTGDDSYRITLAVAGFRQDEIDIVVQNNQLTVSGRKDMSQEGAERYLHRGIAARSFERRFELADFIQVRSAAFDNGLLSIQLEREIPEAMKPRRIDIETGTRPSIGRAVSGEERSEAA